MHVKSTISNVALVWLAAAAAFAGAATPDDAWAKAKHKRPKMSSASNDPCAGPTAFINDHIKKIRELQAKQSEHNVTSIAGLFQSRRSDPEIDIRISDLKRDAESVNGMLRAGGCNPVDIERELRGPSGR